jgi:hypothetical protein
MYKHPKKTNDPHKNYSTIDKTRCLSFEILLKKTKFTQYNAFEFS